MAERLLRYDEFQLVKTYLDPFSDITSWIRSLKSSEYSKSLILKHGKVRGQHNISEAARAIGAHAESAINFLDKVFSGQPEISYLPIYYCMLNLAKIIIIVNGKIYQLRTQKTHGAIWSGSSKSSQNLVTDTITLMGKGTIPLYYEALTGALWSKTSQRGKDKKWFSSHKRTISLKNIYPYLIRVSHEYSTVHKSIFPMEDIKLYINHFGQGKGRFEIQTQFNEILSRRQKSKIKILSGLSIRDNFYVTKTFRSNTRKNIVKGLNKQFRRFLIYDTLQSTMDIDILDYGLQDQIKSFTPISNSTFLLPEEIPILLAFFHLGSVCRYDPERMKRYLNSPSVKYLEPLIRQGAYRFCELFWCNLNQISYIIHS